MKTDIHTDSTQVTHPIRHVLAVMSGKGGVGKSITAALLAAGWQVGLLDANVTGASLPKRFGVRPFPLADGQLAIFGAGQIEAYEAAEFVPILQALQAQLVHGAV